MEADEVLERSQERIACQLLAKGGECDPFKPLNISEYFQEMSANEDVNVAGELSALLYKEDLEGIGRFLSVRLQLYFERQAEQKAQSSAVDEFDSCDVCHGNDGHGCQHCQF